VRIHGFVKVPQTIVGSRDGVMVFDSLGGPSLAHRIRETGGWREVALYRAAPQDAQLTITFALSGIGEAWLDEVAVTLLEPPLAAAPQQENQGSNTASVADRRGPERPS
jgi:hypothetical protein